MACIVHDLDDSTKQMHPGLIAKLLDAANTENGGGIQRFLSRYEWLSALMLQLARNSDVIHARNVIYYYILFHTI